MDDKESTCYIIGDTIILPFDLNDDDVLNVENVPSNIDAINHSDQQPEPKRDQDESSLTSLHQPIFPPDAAASKKITESNELDLANNSLATERFQFETQSRELTGFKFGNQSGEANLFELSRKSIDTNILELANQQTESDEFEFTDQTAFSNNRCEERHDSNGSQLISSNSETKAITSNRERDEGEDEDFMANYEPNITSNSLSQNHTQESNQFSYSLDTFSGNNHPCVSANSRTIPLNTDIQDNNFLISSNCGTESMSMRIPQRLFWQNNVELGLSHNNSDHQNNANSFLQQASDFQNNQFFSTSQPQRAGSSLGSQNVDHFILPDVDMDNISFTNASWGDEHSTISGQDGSLSYPQHNYGAEIFANVTRENTYVNSPVPCDPLGRNVSNERLHNVYSENTPVNNCAKTEDNRLLLTSSVNGVIPGNGRNRLSMPNLVELSAYPPQFAQQHQMQGFFQQFDGRYSSTLQPSSDLVHPNVNSIQHAQVFQPYMEQVYQTNDNLNTNFNTSSFMLNRPIMYESQPTNSHISQRVHNDDDSGCPYIFPQFNGSNVFATDGKIPQLQGYFQPADMACLETPMKDATNNRPADAFIEKILQTVHGAESSTEPAYQSGCTERVDDETNCGQPMEETDDVKLQKVLSMERALRCEIQGNTILPPKAWASKYQSSSGSKQLEPVQELDPKTKAEMKREEVANAAKAIFMKRTGTLFHWIHPGESKSELKTRVEQAWSRLSEKESNYYFSQVLGRCNSDFQTRPMVNPRLMELLNPGDYQELAGILNNDSAGDILLPEPMEDAKRPNKQNSFKQRRQRERQRPYKALTRNSKITRGHEARQTYSSTHTFNETDPFGDATVQGVSSTYGRSSNKDEQLSYPFESSLLNKSTFSSNQNEFSPSTDIGLPDLDQMVFKEQDRTSCTNTLSSSNNYEYPISGCGEDGMLSNGMMHSFAIDDNSGRQKGPVKNRGPRGLYKKKGRLSKNATNSDEDWELNPTTAQRRPSTSGKEKPSFSHLVTGENDSENSYEANRYARDFEVDGNSLDSDGNTLNQRDGQYSVSESLTKMTSNVVHKKKGSRGPRGPYKKRKQETGRGRGRGRGRPPKRRKMSSEEEYSTDASFSQHQEDSFSSPRNAGFSRLDWSSRQFDDDSFDPCVSRQCESFSGKVKPSLQLQQELRNSFLPEADSNNEVDSAEERNSDDQWSSHGDEQPSCSYGSSLGHSSKRISDRNPKSESQARAKARTKASEAFLVESEAMQMQFYQEVSSEDESKGECAPIQSLPLTSADVAVNSLRRLHGSAHKSAHPSSGTDTSDVDWSPRQLRCLSGKTSRRGFKSTRTRQRNSQTSGAHGVAIKGSLRF